MPLIRPHPRTRISVSLYALVPVPVAAVLSAALLRFPFLPSWVGWLFTVLWIAALFLYLTVYIPLRYRYACYCIGNTHITAVSGVYFLTTRQMPLSCVRHITIICGPLERRWGYAFAVVSGAGGWLLLEGIDRTEATALSDRLIRREKP